MTLHYICGLIGFMCGAISTVLAGLAWGSSLSKKDEKKLKESASKLELMGSVKYRFTQVNEITERQLSIVSQAERPSASAAHSRYKNDMAGLLKSLEEEKMNIFRSILKDGIDPNLTIMIDGESKKIRMSEAVAQHDGTSATPVKTEPSKPKNNGLRLITPDEDSNASEDREVP